ncbi:hypothetical protein TNCV_5064671 [Trichonephila clavipes]|nr:hypothetical protein TNCV_5064671 [Trichonephila clavipes]
MEGSIRVVRHYLAKLKDFLKFLISDSRSPSRNTPDMHFFRLKTLRIRIVHLGIRQRPSFRVPQFLRCHGVSEVQSSGIIRQKITGTIENRFQIRNTLGTHFWSHLGQQNPLLQKYAHCDSLQVFPDSSHFRQ